MPAPTAASISCPETINYPLEYKAEKISIHLLLLYMFGGEKIEMGKLAVLDGFSLAPGTLEFLYKQLTFELRLRLLIFS